MTAASPEKGQGEARTRLAAEFSGGSGGAVGGSDGGSGGPGDGGLAPVQFDLLAGVAETSNAGRRARGRPEGSANRRNDDQFDYYEALGFKAPDRALMELVAADPRELAARLAGCKPEAITFERALDVLKLQVKAAADLLPYKLAKKPQQLEVKKGVLHWFVAGAMADADAGKIEQNQWVDLRDGDNAAQAEGIAEEYQGDR